MGLLCFVWVSGEHRRVLHAVAATRDRDGGGVVKEPIEDRSGGGHVGEELAPFFQGPIARHDGRTVLVAAHHHFQQVFAGMFGQLFEAHVINDDQIGLQVFPQGIILLIKGFVLHEVPDQIEDGTVEH